MNKTKQHEFCYILYSEIFGKRKKHFVKNMFKTFFVKKNYNDPVTLLVLLIERSLLEKSFKVIE